MSRLLVIAPKVLLASRCLSTALRRSSSTSSFLSTLRIPNWRNAIVLVRRLREPPSKSSKKQSSSSNEKGAEEASSSEGGNKDEKPDIEQLAAKLKRFFAISLFAFGASIMIGGAAGENTHSTTWSNFVNNILPTGQIQRIMIIPERDVAYIFMYPGAKDLKGNATESRYRMGIPSVPRIEAEIRAAEMAIGLPPEHWTPVEFKRAEAIGMWVSIILLGGLLLGSAMLLKRFKSFNMKDMMSNMTKGKYTVIDPHSPEGKSKLKIKFKDVAGCFEPKQEIREFVDYLRNPSRYTKLGAKLPRGALLTGPPGCGKTLLAKALAAESTVPFISMNGSEFVEVIGGLGASRIRGLFKEAQQRAPCIIYIDEIDAIGRKRSEGKGAGGLGGGSGEEEQTLNQLLVEMDGMGSGQGIVVLASTNRPDILDKALLRPGRFDRHINIDLPTVSERKEMFDLYLKKIKLEHSPSLYSLRLAQMTPGMSGADISNVVNEAAIRAASTNKKIVTVKELDYALDRILAGAEKRSRSLVEEEREIVAYHEAGHALVGWLLEHTDALLKVTIIPRTSAALGFAQYNPRDRKLYSKEELFDRMCMMLGGRCAENIKFGRITTGAEDDLKKVTRSAFAQIKVYGMCESLGPLSFPHGGDFEIKPYSKQLGALLDQEATLLVGKAFRMTDDLIKKNADKLETIAQALLKREVLNYDDVKKLIGPPPHGEKHVVEVVDSVLPNDTISPDPAI